MTEQPPEEEESTPAPMPRWVPILIGAVLVILAALAIFTGLRYREDDDTILAHVPPRKARPTAPAPGGEPGAGASLVLPENTPVANEPVTGTSQTMVTGGPGGIQTMARYWARRGVVFNVLPEDTLVYVNELP